MIGDWLWAFKLGTRINIESKRTISTLLRDIVIVANLCSIKICGNAGSRPPFWREPTFGMLARPSCKATRIAWRDCLPKKTDHSAVSPLSPNMNGANGPPHGFSAPEISGHMHRPSPGGRVLSERPALHSMGWHRFRTGVEAAGDLVFYVKLPVCRNNPEVLAAIACFLR